MISRIYDNILHLTCEDEFESEYLSSIFRDTNSAEAKIFKGSFSNKVVSITIEVLNEK